MHAIRSSTLPALAAAALFVSQAKANADSTCLSYGIDFQDGGDYFINTASNDNFTCVSQFEQCNADVADVMLVDPNGTEYVCSDIPTTPDDTDELSTCPIAKSQMFSGLWMILLFGNNGDGNPFAYERDITLDCGPQVTSTYTPTLTWSITTTPLATATQWSTVTVTSTFGPTTTITIPTKTARRTKTVTPAPVTSTYAFTLTRHRETWTKIQSVVTKTQTASCTIPQKPQNADPTCKYTPTKLHPAALQPTGKRYHYVRGADRPVDVEYARRRILEAKRRRGLQVLNERAPDAPTLTVTDATAVNSTVFITAPTSTVTEIDLTTVTRSTTLPPATVYAGVLTSTITLPRSTTTRFTIAYTTKWATKTLSKTWTLTKHVTPTAAATACKKAGGHFGNGRR